MVLRRMPTIKTSQFGFLNDLFEIAILAVQQLAKVYARTANIRKNALQQATSWLARTKSVIVLEDLNVSGMLKNHHLA